MFPKQNLIFLAQYFDIILLLDLYREQYTQSPDFE